MKPRELSLTAFIVALAMTGSVALAQTQTPSFEEMDRDGDGLISRSESMALPCLARVFNELDKEEEEGLNRSEYQNAVREHCQPSRGQDRSES